MDKKAKGWQGISEHAGEGGRKRAEVLSEARRTEIAREAGLARQRKARLILRPKERD